MMSKTNEPTEPTLETRKLKALGAAIGEQRRRIGLSIQETAKLLEVSGATVSRIENGIQPMTVATLLKLSEILSFSAGALLVQVQAAESKTKADREMWSAIRKVVVG